MKIALVTGGGTGIGRAAALELNKIDYVVYVVGRREEELNKTSSLAENKNFKIIPVKTDITNGNEVIDLFHKIKNDHGRIDLLFNNAGMGAPRVPIEELKEIAKSYEVTPFKDYSEEKLVVENIVNMLEQIYILEI